MLSPSLLLKMSMLSLFCFVGLIFLVFPRLPVNISITVSLAPTRIMSIVSILLTCSHAVLTTPHFLYFSLHFLYFSISLHLSILSLSLPGQCSDRSLTTTTAAVHLLTDPSILSSCFRARECNFSVYNCWVPLNFPLC